MDRIYLSKPHLSGKELELLQETLSSNWITTQGPMVNGFEKDLKSYLGEHKEIVALNSGTSALHLALVQLSVNRGDEVICQSFTFVASANAIKYCGATPIFVDSESLTWNICPELLEVAIKDRIQEGKKPKAIIVVHTFGMPAQLDKIVGIASKYQIPIVEDAACALGSDYKGIKCGTFGDYGVISFNGNKIITTSAGGILICSSEKEKQSIIHLATQAKNNSLEYEHNAIGFNYRMSNVLAAIGRSQMKVLQNRIDTRRSIFEKYKDVLSKFEQLKFLEEPNGYYSNRWLSCLLVSSKELRNELLNALAKNNIEVKPLWKPMHLQDFYKDYPSYLNGVSEDLNARGLCLPSSSNLTENEFHRITESIIQVLEHFYEH